MMGAYFFVPLFITAFGNWLAPLVQYIDVPAACLILLLVRSVIHEAAHFVAGAFVGAPLTALTIGADTGDLIYTRTIRGIRFNWRAGFEGSVEIAWRLKTAWKEFTICIAGPIADAAILAIITAAAITTGYPMWIGLTIGMAIAFVVNIVKGTDLQHASEALAHMMAEGINVRVNLASPAGGEIERKPTRPRST